MKIACVGAGPAGLYLAILLKRRDPGNEITVFEQNSAGVTQGWGVVFWEDLLEDLRRNDPETAHAIAAQSFHWVGQILDIKGSEPLNGPGGGFSIRRQQLLKVLSERAVDLGVCIEYERKIASADELGRADVVVAADGVGSRLRNVHAEKFRPRVIEGRNKYVWLGATKVFSAFKFGFVSTDAGWIWFHAYGFDQDMSTFVVECPPDTWTHLHFDRLGAQASLALLESIFEQHLDGGRLLSQVRTESALPWQNFRNLTNEQWHTDNIVLVGDAAHTTHFSIGSGTRLAMQDAIALARNLQTHGTTKLAFETYQRERKLAMVRPQKEARLSAQWFESISRYVGLEASQFFRLLLGRRSPLIPHVPPQMYCQMDTLTKEFAVLRALRTRAAEFYRQRMNA